jgi:uncharacterized protein
MIGEIYYSLDNEGAFKGEIPMKRILINHLILFALLIAMGASTAGAQTNDTGVYINEIQVSTAGTDWEFFELKGAAGTDLSNLSLVGIESDTGSLAGTIDLVVSLAGQSIPSGGFWLGISPTGAATYGITGELTIADNSFENSTATYFLVSGFIGALGDDLDTSDDGILDSTPWASILDSINIRDSVTDFNYGAPSVGPDGTFLPSGTFRCPDAPDGTFDNNIHNFSVPDGTPGMANNCPPPPPVEACGDEFIPIYEVQGSDLVSPLVGSEVAVEGIVIGDFQENDGDPFDTNLDGFYIQDAHGDGDAATSDGIFVFAPGGPDVTVGDNVRVRGSVIEFFGLTQIGNVNLLLHCSSGNSITPIPISLPVTTVDEFEAYEGMLVAFPQPLFISEFFNFDRFGEIVLTTQRQFQPTAIFGPGSPEAAQLAEINRLSRITLDDGRSAQNPNPAIHPNGDVFDLDNLFRGGDMLENVTGVMDSRFNLYRIQPTQGADFTVMNPRPDRPDDVGGNLKVASFNVLNYFVTIDTRLFICGPTGGQECRGADTLLEFERQRAKIISALSEIDADIVGLIEIENAPTDAPVQDLVSGLNETLGAGTYDFIPTGPIGTDAIKQAFIYKPATVSLIGDFAVLDSDEFVDPTNSGEARNRPALAQTFMDSETGGIFTAVVNHFKSKGSSCGAGDDDPAQGNCNLTRTLSAQVLSDWLAGDPTGSNDADFLIIGDLNSYDKEDPIDVLIDNGYIDLAKHFQGENAYSYLFDGQLGYLDYAMPNMELLDEVTGLTIWHINADEPDLIDYDMTFKQDAQDALFEPNAFRSSDHDPVINGLTVCDEIPPTLEVSVTPDTLWPPDHRYVEVRATVTAADNFDPNPTVTLISVTSNEPDDGEDDGNTVNDIVILDDFTFKLRAERSGVGTGRVYTITYQVSDACGNVTEQSATVSVPLSFGR